MRPDGGDGDGLNGLKLLFLIVWTHWFGDEIHEFPGPAGEEWCGCA